MNEMVTVQDRWLRSAHALLAYYERKFKIPLTLLTQEPDVQDLFHKVLPQSLRSMGLWGVAADRELLEAEFNEISTTLMMVLGDLSELKKRSSGLEHMRSALELKLRQSVEKNVIPLASFRNIIKAKNPYPDIEKQSWRLRQDCLIDAKDRDEVHKMAFELYTHDSRYAFLEYEILDAGKRNDLSELLQLGSVILFIPSVFALSLNEQVILNTLIELNTLNRPLLMVGTNRSCADLRLEPRIFYPLVENLARAYIKLSKPVAVYKREGLIKYFLDSLSQYPT